MAAKTLVYFPHEVIVLNEEVRNHPELLLILAQKPQDFERQIMEIAAYCEVVLNGTYDFKDFMKLAEILTKKLREKRGGIIIVDGVVN